MEKTERADSGRPPISLVAAAAWSIALTMTWQLFIGVTEAARPGALDDLVNVTACDVLAVSLILFAMMRVHAPTSSLRRFAGVRGVSILHVCLSALAGAGVSPALAGIDTLIERRFPLATEDVERQTHMLSSIAGGRATLVVALVLVFPIAEELLFRGVLFGGLRKGRTQGITIVATGMLFACSSLDPRAAPTVLVLGLVLGWLRAQSGSVISSCFAHAAFYGVRMVPALRGADPSADVEYPLTWAAGAMAVALVALLCGSVLGERDASATAARADDE